MPEHVETPENIQIAGLPILPDDVTLAEVADLMRGRPIVRDGVVVVDKLEITDQQINDILAEAGIELGDEDDIYGE